jgi:hypothetical protein
MDKFTARRNFLKAAGLLAVSAAGVAAGYPFVDRNRGLLFGVGPDVKNIPSEIPQSLQGLEVPTVNENLKTVNQIMENGLFVYEGWRKKNPGLPELVYKKPENYLDVFAMVRSMKKVSSYDPVGLNLINDYNLVLDTFRENDLPYANYMDGSGGGIDGAMNMVAIDPGTGLVASLKGNFKKLYGEDFDIWSKCKGNSLTDEQLAELESNVQSWFDKATLYVREYSESIGGKRVSSSILFAYFLNSNKGNILRSIWDTAVYFKIASRNDIPSLKYSPSREKADFVGKYFLDEFTESVSVNWVIDNVPKNDKDLNAADKYAHPEWKDYMPVNRAGDFYHFWNILGLCSVLSPELAKRLVTTHLTPVDPESGSIVQDEYGRVKTVADVRTVSQAEDISALLATYTK